MPSNSQDTLFTAALKRLPQPLRDALVESEMADAALLQSYPRYSALELELQTAQPKTDIDCTQISLAPVIFGVAAHDSMVHSDSCVVTQIDST